MKYEDAMKLDKSTLAERLANKNHNSQGSKYNPFKQDGINLITLGQEGGLLLALDDRPPGGGGTPRGWLADKQYGNAGKAYLRNLTTLETTSGKLVIGSTIVGGIASFIKRRGRTIKAGIFKLN